MVDNHAPMPGGYESVLVNGKEWKFSWVGPGIRKAYVAWAKARSRERFMETENAVEKKESFDWLRSAIAAGKYDWGSPSDPNGIGEHIAESMQTQEGLNKIMGMLLEPAHGPVSQDELMDLMTSNMGTEVSHAVMRAIAPNRRTPLQAGVNGQSQDPAMASVTPIS